MGTTTLDIADLEGVDAIAFKEDSGVKGIEVVDDEKGIVKAFVSVTGVKDRVNDIIHPGAYEKTLAARTPKGLIGHDWKQLVSKALEVKELMPGDPGLPSTLPNGDPWPADAGALYVEAQYNLNTERGRDAYEDAKFFGQDQEWSIGYSVPKSKDAAFKDKDGTRHIKQLDLFEYSQVLWGAMPFARTQSVKDVSDIQLEVKDGTLDQEVSLPDGSYPIKTRADLQKAINLRNHGKSAKKAIFGHIKRCAAMLGATDMLPDDMKEIPEDEIKKDEEVSDSTVDYKALHMAWQTIGQFLHDAKVIPDDLFAKVADTNIEGKSTAAELVQDYKNLFDDDAYVKAARLGTQYDFAIELGTKDAIKVAQDRWGAFLGEQQTKGVEVGELASDLLALVPEEKDDDLVDAEIVPDDHKDDKSGDVESKGAPVLVTMTKEEMMARLGRV